MEKNNENLHYHKVKDSIVILIAVFIIVLISIFSILSFSNNSETHVEIKYQNYQLYDLETNKKEISFPSSGEKKITYKKEDGLKMINKEFDFKSESITFTLYSDKSIQILKQDITCSDHICSKMGRIYTPNTPIVCLKNQIQIMIVKNTTGEYDA